MKFVAMFPNICRKWLAVMLALVSAIALSGCNPTELKTEAAQVPQLVVSVLSDPQTFNFALNQQSPSIFGLTFKGLTSVNGVTGEIQPELAESWQLSDDKLRIVFTLREGLKWSDGEPLTADDVIFTYEEIVFNKEIPTDARDYVTIGASGDLPKVRKLDDRRVEFILPEPFAPFLTTTTGHTSNAIAILPKHALQESVRSKNSEGNPKFLSTWVTDTDPAKIIVNGFYKI